MSKQPGCPGCDAQPGNSDCGGHWSRRIMPRGHSTGTRPDDNAGRATGTPNLDKIEQHLEEL